MAELTGQTPYIEVFDMIASMEFYCGLLGFDIVYASPEVTTREGTFSHFNRLRRDRVELLLNTAYDSNERPAARSEPRWSGCRHWHLYIDCFDVPGLFREVAERGAKADRPAPTGYGYLGFSVTDPDGYRLTFHQPL